MRPEEIAFNDFKNAVSIKEFEAVLSLCDRQYNKVKTLVDRREQFIEDSRKKFGEADSVIDDDKIKSGLKKIIDALVEKADQELVKLAKEEIKDIKEITEFLKRFSETDSYEYLDLRFLDKFKKQ